ncbi:MAG: transglutaminase domain-containing protein [Flavobacterium sp.]|nr:transglutaminase domain-containing protein [Flavobacterium sp.]
MKKIPNIALLLFLFIRILANAQDFKKVDVLVKNYPKSFSSPDDLAIKINDDFTRDDEKARAIYTWIAFNVAYDVKTYFAPAGNTQRTGFSYRTQSEKEQKERAFEYEFARKTLRSKLAVCQGYAMLFKDVCLRLGISCELVSGTSKTKQTNIGKMPIASDHAWNAVRIDGKWQLIDVTWAAGYVDENTREFSFDFSGGYFFTDPEVFFLNHFPDDKKWLLIDKTEKDFADLPLYSRGYSTAPYTIVAPEMGIITAIKDNLIPFEILDLPIATKVGYLFSSEGKLTSANLTRNGNATTFNVLLGKRSRGFLTIYVNNRSIATYKLGK